MIYTTYYNIIIRNTNYHTVISGIDLCIYARGPLALTPNHTRSSRKKVKGSHSVNAAVAYPPVSCHLSITISALTLYGHFYILTLTFKTYKRNMVVPSVYAYVFYRGLLALVLFVSLFAINLHLQQRYSDHRHTDCHVYDVVEA